MRVALKKWGNSVSIRIPAAVMREFNLSVDQEVNLRAEDGKLLIEPICEKGPRYSLDELLAGIRPDNLHEAVDFGEPVGKEIW
jgi:antitoxin MazE